MHPGPRITKKVRTALRRAGFRKYLSHYQKVIAEAMLHVRFLRRYRYLDYVGEEAHRYPNKFRRPQGRPHERDMRNYVLGHLYYAWLREFGESPNINNKKFTRSPFVFLVEMLSPLSKEKNIERRLEEFRAAQRAAWKRNDELLAAEAREVEEQQISIKRP